MSRKFCASVLNILGNTVNRIIKAPLNDLDTVPKITIGESRIKLDGYYRKQTIRIIKCNQHYE